MADLPVPEILANVAGAAVVMYFMSRQVALLMDDLKAARDEARRYQEAYEALLLELAHMRDEAENKPPQ